MSFSIQCAAVLIQLLKKQRDAAGLSIFSETVELHTQAKSTPMHQKLLFSELEKTIYPYTLNNARKHLL